MASSSANVPLGPMKYIAHLASAQSGTRALQVWSTAHFSDLTSSSPPKPLPISGGLGYKIRQVIAIWDARLLFLDTNLWVCSLDLDSQELSAEAVKRHFFLLPEWQNRTGSEPFLMAFSEAKREFSVAFKDRLLVVRRGLDIAEPWAS